MAASTTIDEVRREKQALRKEIRSLIKELSDDEITAQSDRVWARLFALPEYQSARSVGLFLSMPHGEIKTDAALRRILKDGKELYVPRVGLCFEKCDMDFVLAREDDTEQTDDGHDSKCGKDVMFYDAWPRNKWSIPEPPALGGDTIAKPGGIDLLIVPGVAFDRLGNRIGHGKGYYDRFISFMGGDEGKMKPLLVAVGLSHQLLGGDDWTPTEGKEPPIVPTLHHDFEMDILLFPRVTLNLSSRENGEGQS